MSDHWAQGYVTDLEYLPGFYRDLAPAHLDLVCLLNSVAPPEPERPGRFRYCELGCGQGLTTLVLAAANPGAEFWAVDFNPAHIARARALAAEAGLGNVAFLEDSFENLADPRHALPEFDYVTMHGVYSWVSADLRAAIRRFLARFTRPGAAVHLSYNVLPGWTQGMALQHLLKGFAAEARGRSDDRVTDALERVRAVAAAGSAYLADNAFLRRIGENAAQHDAAYLAHEYLTPNWAPHYHADVVRGMAEAKLDFVGSAAILQNFADMMMTAEQQALRDTVADPVLRETLKDYFTNRAFRADVFVRGRRMLERGERDARLGAVRLASLRPRPQMGLTLKVPAGQIDLNPDVYGPMLDALEHGPQTVEALAAAARLAPGERVNPVEVAGMLAGTEAVVPVLDDGAVAPPPALNDALGRAALRASANRPSAVVLPRTGSGLSCPGLEVAVLALVRELGTTDADRLARAVWAPITARGEAMIRDGEPVVGEEANLAIIRERVGQVLEMRLDLWRAHGALAQDVA